MSVSGSFSDSDEFPEPASAAVGGKKADDDDEFAFAGDGNAKDDPLARTTEHDNQHYDEAMVVSDESLDESVTSPEASPANKRMSKPAGVSGSGDFSSSDDSSADDATRGGAARGGGGAQQQAQPQASNPATRGPVDSDGDSSTDSSSDDDDEPTQTAGAKLYNPNEYKHLSVSNQIQELFDHIGRHKPNEIELETHLKPFIPEFIPAVGDIDAFVKIPPPDEKIDGLGLIVLDEPAAQQSDPTVLDLQLRVVSKQTNLQPMTVRNIEHADKHPKKITTWVNNIEEVHRKKPPPNVNYSKNMPDIEALMQVWPSEMEELLKEIPLPNHEMDLSVTEFTKVVCAMLDIPVYDKVTESLHVLFTLYSEFKNNVYLNNSTAGGGM